MTDLKHQPNNVHVVNVAARQAAHKLHLRHGFPDLRVFMVALIGFCVFLTVYATQALLPMFRDKFATSEFHVSLTVSATTIAIALGSPIVGLLAEKWGRREVMIGSVSLLTIPILLAATSHSLNTLIGDYWDDRGRRFWLALQGSAGPLLASVMIFGAGYLTQLRWNGVFLIYLAFTAAGIVAAFNWHGGWTVQDSSAIALFWSWANCASFSVSVPLLDGSATRTFGMHTATRAKP